MILLILVLVVNVNTFPSFSQSVSSRLSVTLVILPLLLFCFTVIRNILGCCYKGNSPVFQQLHNPTDEDEDNNDSSKRRYEVHLHVSSAVCHIVSYRSNYLII